MDNNQLTSEAISFINSLAAYTKELQRQAKPKLLLKEAIEKAISFYADERSEKTVRSVRTATKHLLTYAGNIPIDSIDINTVQSFFIWIRIKAPKGVYVYKRTLQAVWSYFLKFGIAAENPFQKYSLPKIQKSELITITRFELDKVLQFVPNRILKDLFLFDFFSGMRAGEIINLCWSDVNLDKLQITIGSDTFTTKGKKIRYVPLCSEAADILHRNKPRILKINSKRHFVFHKTNGLNFSTAYISKQFKKAVIAAGVNPKIHFHTLRHGFATALASRGISIYKIKELLGHSSVTTTEIYANLNIENLRNAIEVFNS